MDELRWILLGAAVVIIIGIYVFSRNRKRDNVYADSSLDEDVPSFSAKDGQDDGWVDGVGPVRVVESTSIDKAAEHLDTVIEQNRVSQSESEADSAETIEPQPLDPEEDEYEDQEVEASATESTESNAAQQDVAIDDVIAVYVLGSSEEPLIRGEKILSASYAMNLQHGDMKIFHRYADDDSAKILFSMANIQEPGWFDIENINQLETKGLSFFMQVNLVDEPSKVLDDMLICAHGIATMLGASLCNPHRQLLDEAYTNMLREKVRRLSELKPQSI